MELHDDCAPRTDVPHMMQSVVEGLKLLSRNLGLLMVLVG